MNSFLEKVAEDIHENLGIRLRDSALVFVNKRPLVYMQDYLSKLARGPEWSPQMFTIQEFMNLSTDLQIADPISQFFLFWQTYKEILPLKEFGKLRMDSFYRTALTILSDFSQLDEELINVRSLFEDLRDRARLDAEFSYLEEESLLFLRNFWATFSVEKISFQQEQFLKMWQRMPHIYQHFHHNLEKKGLITQGGLYRKLAEGREDKPSFLKEFQEGKIIFIGFNALSKSESKLFKKWQDQQIALFYFDTDPYYMEDTLQEAGKFLRRNLHSLGLVNALPASEISISSQDKALKIYKVQGQTAQAKILPQILLPSLIRIKEEGDYRKIAIVLADESLLLPILQSIPNQISENGHPVPINITMGYGLQNSTLYSLIEAWSRLQEKFYTKDTGHIHFRDLQVFLFHPFLPILKKDRDVFLDQIIRQKEIQVPVSFILSHLPEAHIYFDKAQNGIDSLRKLLSLLYFLLEDESRQIGAMEEELGWATVNEINKLLDSFLEFEEDISIPFTLSLVRKSLSTIAIPLAGEPLEGIQIMGLLETRSLDFETIFMLGCSETFVPKTGKRESFIPDSIRKAYGLTVQEDQDALAAYIFYRLFQKGKEIHVLYNAQNSEANSGEPSRFIRQLEFESGHIFENYSYSPDFQSAGSEKIIVYKIGKVWETLQAFFLPEKEVKKNISATALTTYLQCSLRFYYKYLAGIQEPQKMVETLEENVLGSILHSLMETFYLEFLKRGIPIQAEDISKRRKKLPELILSAFRAYLEIEDENKTLSLSGKDKLSLEVVGRYAEKILAWDEKNSPFTLKELENKNYQISFPVHILGKKEWIGLQGIIDRLDERQEIIRIIDYKTGTDDLRFHSLEEIFRRDSKKLNKALVQILFYTLIAEKVLKMDSIEPHLYRVREMLIEDPNSTLFYQKDKKETLVLRGERLKEIKREFENQLKETLEELFNPAIPFIQTKVLENCTYCPYKIPCGRV